MYTQEINTKRCQRTWFDGVKSDQGEGGRTGSKTNTFSIRYADIELAVVVELRRFHYFRSNDFCKRTSCETVDVLSAGFSDRLVQSVRYEGVKCANAAMVSIDLSENAARAHIQHGDLADDARGIGRGQRGSGDTAAADFTSGTKYV
ncbi:hypothetical protein EVAR_28809_1 [Eumeta japonica]|uniref:Uncharacterized protein n=1 Tax=Eumeta variegata TaxID=151549 RepID=A0A4C1WJW5_EUMVA|nr:hypothetical protein EVAR_28809_1 [Eumeta japonica]